MIDISEVVDWLNYGDISRLSTEDEFSFRQLYETEVPQDQKDGALQQLRINVEIKQNVLELAEIKVNLGVYFFNIKNYETAIVYLNDSVVLYPENSHREAVVNLLRGYVFWKLILNIRSHACWSLAIKAFEIQRDRCLLENNEGGSNWYNKQLGKMRVEITMMAEHAYNDWLFRLEPISLDRHTQLIVNEIEERINRRELQSIHDLGIALKKINRLRLNNPIEVSETNIIIGLMYYRLRQPFLSLEYYIKAEGGFFNDAFRNGVTKWMIGISKWELKYENENAFKMWRDAIEQFNLARIEMNRQNNMRIMNWLDFQIPIMEQALEEKNRAYIESFPS